MVKVVNRLFIVSLLGISIMCSAYIINGGSLLKHQTNTVECAPTKTVATLQHKSFQKAEDETGTVTVDEYSDLLKGIDHDSTNNAKGPVEYGR